MMKGVFFKAAFTVAALAMTLGGVLQAWDKLELFSEKLTAAGGLTFVGILVCLFVWYFEP